MRSYFANPYAFNQLGVPAYTVSVRFPGGVREGPFPAGRGDESAREVAEGISQVTHGAREVIRISDRATRRLIAEYRVVERGIVELVRGRE